jgi:hypothetical protein
LIPVASSPFDSAASFKSCIDTWYFLRFSKVPKSCFETFIPFSLKTVADYDSFLITPAYVTHIPDDNDVKVTLSVIVSNYAGELANAGTYTATQTLTVHWVGP